MSSILTYLIIHDPQYGEEICQWLYQGHYPFAVDKKTDKIIVFNLGLKCIQDFLRQFNINEWTYGQNADFPKEYIELFIFVDEKLTDNLHAYRWFTAGKDFKPFITFSEEYYILCTGFEHDGYEAWRIRFYLSRDLLGLDANNFGEENDNETDLIGLKFLSSFLQSGLNYAETNILSCKIPSKLKLRIWIDQIPVTNEIKRVYVGWVSDSTEFINCKGKFYDLRAITDYMNNWMSKLSLYRNTDRSDEINLFIEKAKLYCPGFNPCIPTTDNKRQNNESHSEYKSPNYIHSIIKIPFMDWEDKEKLTFISSFPYAIDEEKKFLILLNQHNNLYTILSKINDLSLVRILHYQSCPKIEDQNLIDFCNSQIEENLKGVKNVYQWVGRANLIDMCGYYHRIRCYGHLHGININKLPEVAINEKVIETDDCDEI